MRFSLVLAALAVSSVAFGQSDGFFQIGYAANLNIGDSVLNLSNDGIVAGPFGATPVSFGNICANVYVFDPQEEEIGCCSCLITPNGLNSLSAKADLTSDNLTAAVPTSIIIKVLGSRPAETGAGGTPFTVCNPATVNAGLPTVLTQGLLAWGTTLEPASTPGTYSPVDVPYLNGKLSIGSFLFPPANVGSEVYGLTQLCNFIQSNGTGYGICKSCRLGALGGSKQ